MGTPLLPDLVATVVVTSMSSDITPSQIGSRALEYLRRRFAVVGKQPFAVAREIEQRLKAYIVAPRVTVNVEESSPVAITVMGEVPTKGALSLQQPAELAQALAQAGGLTEFASESKIFVLRRYPAAPDPLH